MDLPLSEHTAGAPIDHSAGLASTDLHMRCTYDGLEPVMQPRVVMPK
jgi:hypothetical protein